MTDFKKISELELVTSLTDNDRLIVETATGTKATTKSALKEDTVVTKEDIGLGNCDNTADIDKPVSTATQTALDSKLDTSTFDTYKDTTIPETYLSKSDASSIYLTQNNASGTYLSKTDASIYYLEKESGVNYIKDSSLVTTITSSSTDAEIPSAKSVYSETSSLSGRLDTVENLLTGLETLLAEV